MYHYVREFDERYPNFRFLDVENFCLQLDYFAQNYGFVTQDEWSSFIQSEDMGSAQGKILLTFDDALSCHFDYVFPELEKRGLWGIFFASTKPYADGAMLDVHRIQLICGAFNGEDLLNALLELVTDEMIPDKKRDEFMQITYITQTNYSGVSEFKRILNYFVDYSHRETLIDNIALRFKYSFDSTSFYVAPENLLKMMKSGNIIGSHTVNHPVMSKLSYADQSMQIIDSFSFLEGAGLIKQKTYCHPYGGFHSFDENTIDILSKEDIQYSFNVESRDIDPSDILEARHFLPRYDCNEFPHGLAS